VKSRIWCEPAADSDRRWRYLVRVVNRTGLHLIGGNAPTWDQAMGQVNDLHRTRGRR